MEQVNRTVIPASAMLTFWEIIYILNFSTLVNLPSTSVSETAGKNGTQSVKCKKTPLTN